jgi:hypothetical protein
MTCPLCQHELIAKSDKHGWYADCKNPSCLLSVGKIIHNIKFYTNHYVVEYWGAFRTEKLLKKYVNGMRIRGKV